MKWQPEEKERDAKRLGVLAERAIFRLIFGPVQLFRILR